LRAGLSRAIGDSIRHRFDVSVGRIIEDKDLRHDDDLVWLGRGVGTVTPQRGILLWSINRELVDPRFLDSEPWRRQDVMKSDSFAKSVAALSEGPGIQRIAQADQAAGELRESGSGSTCGQRALS
jgi:hypothetical protein